MNKKAAVLSRRWMLATAGVLVAIVALMLGLNVGGLRDRIFGRLGMAPIERIAFLPIENLSKDPADAYLAEGMTVLLIEDMNRMGAVTAPSSVSVQRYRAAPKPLAEFARDLNVEAVVQCGVLRTGDRVRLEARLIEAASGRRLWEQTFDRDMRDLPALRGEVCLAISERIAKVTPEQRARVRSLGPVRPDAQEALMRGMWGGDPSKTEERLKRAVALEPTYAQAHDFLAQMYSMRLMYPAAFAPKEIYPKAREAASRAIGLDPDIVMSPRVLGTVALEYDWNFAEAERNLKRGVQTAPHGTNAHHMYSHFLIAVGRVQEADAESRRALELNPMGQALLSCLSWHDITKGDYEGAEKRARQALGVGAPDQLARLTLGWSYLQRKRFGEAIPEFQRAVVGWKGAVFPTAALGHAYAAAGQEAAAREVLGRLLERSKAGTEYVSPYEIATVCAGLGETDRAFEWLEKAFEDRSTMLVYFRMDPRTSSLRSDRRFQDLLRRMNFPQAAQH